MDVIPPSTTATLIVALPFVMSQASGARILGSAHWEENFGSFGVVEAREVGSRVCWTKITVRGIVRKIIRVPTKVRIWRLSLKLTGFFR